MERLDLYGSECRCWWCREPVGQKEIKVPLRLWKKDYEVSVCSEYCREQTRSTYRYIEKIFPVFPVGMLSSLFILIAQPWIGWPTYTIFLGLALLGLTIVVCPFLTPQTVKMLGLKWGFRVGRMIGSIMFCIAVFCWFKLPLK